MGFNFGHAFGGLMIGGGVGAFLAGRQRGNNDQQVDQQWLSGHSIDPQTGQLQGTPGSIPSRYALQFQDAHEQAVWGYRQRLMQGATDYLQGAAGNLQRFRPGGAAAMESGIYQNVAGNMMQQAAQTQPMNLLREYERQAGVDARRQMRNASYLQAAVTLGAAAIGAAGGGHGMTIAPSFNQQQPQGGAPGGGTGAAGMDIGGQMGANYGGQPGFPGGVGGAFAQGGTFGQPQGGVPPDQVGAFGQALQSGMPGSAQSQVSPGQSSAGPGGTGGSAQQQRQSGSGGGAGGDVHGSSGTAAGPSDPTAGAQQLLVMSHMADLMDQDPAFRQISSAIDTEVMLRAYGRAA